jgi:hypothetical protein
MNKFIKYTAIGVAGYLIGYYEMKYKVVKLLLKAQLEKDVKQEENEAQS